MVTGLRERKKQETRQAISDIATQLFLERGFETVTIAQVADAAGVSKMTVTNYFPRKEDLVFDRAQGIVDGLADAIARRAPGESLLAAVRRNFEEAAARGDVTLGLSSAAFAAMISGSPVLTGRGLEIASQRERALGDAIAAEAGHDDVQQRVVAGLLSAVYDVLYAEGWRRSLAGEPRADILRALLADARRSFDLLEPALGGYGIRPLR
jgi:AcrR family transcriptional regulator